MTNSHQIPCYVTIISANVVTGEMKLYAGGQQPYQRTIVGSNVLESSFMVKSKKLQALRARVNMIDDMPHPKWTKL